MSEGDYTVFVVVEEPCEVEAAGVQAAAWYSLQMVGASAPCALTLTLTGSERVQEFNREYAGIDEPTDVLSFAAEDEPYAVEPGEPPYLGDVIIAVPVARQQAAEAGHSLLNELQLLAIHGTLHLLGFDHQTPDQQAEMWAYQSAAMDALRQAGYS
jgi:probable rRNA maturation factor